MKFFQKDQISGDNKYYCEKCKGKVNATKSYIIDRSPESLFFQIKRFNNRGDKISKKVQIIKRLNLKAVSTDRSSYELTGVVVHSGWTLHGGHYYAYGKTADGWACVNLIVFLLFSSTTPLSIGPRLKRYFQRRSFYLATVSKGEEAPKLVLLQRR